MSNLTPRERRHQKTKQAILQAAQNIITEKGADGLSLREIAQRIDYSPAGLYEYFNSKDDLIVAVCAEELERFGAYLNRVSTDLAPAERIIQLGQAYLDFAQNNPEHFMVIFTMASPQGSAAGLAAGNTPYTILRQAVEAYVEAEQITLPAEYTIDDVTYIFWAKVHGMAMLRQMSFCQNEGNIGSIHRWAFELFEKGLKTV
jgi:AcrR family transcriptional regulator